MRLRDSSREIVEGERDSSREIARIESPRCFRIEIAYRSCRVIWAPIGSSLLGGSKESTVSQIAPPSKGGGIAFSI